MGDVERKRMRRTKRTPEPRDAPTSNELSGNQSLSVSERAALEWAAHFFWASIPALRCPFEKAIQNPTMNDSVGGNTCKAGVRERGSWSAPA
jgi:hypothetical protein